MVEELSAVRALGSGDARLLHDREGRARDARRGARGGARARRSTRARSAWRGSRTRAPSTCRRSASSTSIRRACARSSGARARALGRAPPQQAARGPPARQPLRDASCGTSIPRAPATCAPCSGELERRGAPNCFGEQRFGARGDTWCIGRALLADDAGRGRGADRGPPGPARPRAGAPRARAVRAGAFGSARRAPSPAASATACAWPARWRASGAGRGGRSARSTASSLRLPRLGLAVARSSTSRSPSVSRASTRCSRATSPGSTPPARSFEVLDVEAERAAPPHSRSPPTGPLFGGRMTRPRGRPAEIEDARARRRRRAPRATSSSAARSPRRAGAGRCASCRASSRSKTGADEAGPFLELRFALPAGCYATAVLREVLKPAGEAAEAADEPEGAYPGPGSEAGG